MARAVDFKGRGQRGGEFHDAMIEKRRPHFDGVRHAHAVDFGENIVGQKIFLIEPEDRARAGLLQANFPRNSPRMPSSAFGSGDCKSARFSSSENVPFQKTCARSGDMGQPSRKRFTLYSKLILSSETGQWLTACSARRTADDGRCRAVRARCVGAIGEVAAEEFVGAFAAERHGGAAFAHFGEEPDGQCAGVGVGLVGVVGELLDGASQIFLRIQIEFLVIRLVVATTWRMYSLSSKLRPRKEIEKVFRRDVETCAA